MAQSKSSFEIEKTIHLAPTESIQHALGANHDICSGIDELVDNSIDAMAENICIVFHVDGNKLTQIAVHDDGRGMDAATMERVLRLGGHESQSHSNIGIYGMGLKEGSYANADTVTVLSRVKGQFPTGIQLHKESFTADVLKQQATTAAWNLRDRLVDLKRGTSILWNDLTGIYEGSDTREADAFLSGTIEKLRRHLGIRYHRFLHDNWVSIKIFMLYDAFDPVPAPSIKPIDPCGYRKPGDRLYPLHLTERGREDGPGVTAHIWNNRSKSDEFILEGKDELGHQGFYIYIADRLITQGGWCGFQEPRKDYKLLRVVIDDPRVINEYITISPQKGSVRLGEGFHRFIDELRVCGEPEKNFDAVCSDAIAVLRNSSKKSGNPDVLTEAGQGIAPVIKEIIEDEANLKKGDPVNVVWTELEGDKFVEVSPRDSTIKINRKYRKMVNPGRGSLNDAPLLKTLLYLLFNDVATSKQTRKSKANASLWAELLTTAAKEQERQENLRLGLD